GVAVVTGRPLERLLPAALPHHTAALRAAVPRRAGRAVGERRTPRAHPIQALLLGGAGVAVVAGRPVRHVRPRALSAHTPLTHRAGVAVVAGRPIRLPPAAGAHPGLAAVARRAAVAVVARRAVRLGGVGAGAVAVAGAGLVALVGCRAGEVRAAACPPRTDVVLGARVAVVVGCAVRLGGVGMADRVDRRGYVGV